jgi:beta-lactamase regulating signal transducer with metallopeptidase domain
MLTPGPATREGVADRFSLRFSPPHPHWRFAKAVIEPRLIAYNPSLNCQLNQHPKKRSKKRRLWPLTLTFRQDESTRQQSFYLLRCHQIFGVNWSRLADVVTQNNQAISVKAGSTRCRYYDFTGRRCNVNVKGCTLLAAGPSAAG